jgi:hypothetical protein
MKLILAGSTGFVATEILRQAIHNPAITSIIAIARRETVLDDGADTTKLKSVICDDFGNYSEEIKKEIAGADACIWYVVVAKSQSDLFRGVLLISLVDSMLICNRTIAVTPSKLKTMTLEEVNKICYDYTVTGIETMAPLASKEKPFRFIYISGANGERDQTKRPRIMGDYALIRVSDHFHFTFLLFVSPSS